MDETRL
jgi:hypothetical protein